MFYTVLTALGNTILSLTYAMTVINYHICDSLSKNLPIITLPESWFQATISIAFLSIIELHHEPRGNMEDSSLKEYTATYIS